MQMIAWGLVSGGGRQAAAAAPCRLLDACLATLPQGPCCHDGLSARLIERAGFDFAFMSGFCTAAARLGAPDTGAQAGGALLAPAADVFAPNLQLSFSAVLCFGAGLMSYAEMVDTGRNCHEATRHLPSEALVAVLRPATGARLAIRALQLPCCCS